MYVTDYMFLVMPIGISFARAVTHIRWNSGVDNAPAQAVDRRGGSRLPRVRAGLGITWVAEAVKLWLIR